MPEEIDILKEVGIITAGHGSVALSNILERKITLDVPSVNIISSEEIPKHIETERISMAVFSRIFEGLEGGGAFILDGKNALKLIDLSYKIKQDTGQLGGLVETGLSLIKDIGNIIVDSYLNALGSIFKKVIIPSIPTLISGTIGEILYLMLSPYGAKEYACLIETIFEEPREKIRGGFYLILSPQGIKDVRNACELMWRRRENKE